MSHDMSRYIIMHQCMFGYVS